jgi:hypothetical protein
LNITSSAACFAGATTFIRWHPGPGCPLETIFTVRHAIEWLFSICALTASRLKLAPFGIGGNSIAVWASFPTFLMHDSSQNLYGIVGAEPGRLQKCRQVRHRQIG